MTKIFLNKIYRILARKTDAFVGKLFPIAATLAQIEIKPFELHLELTNLCNANCVFCPFQYQERSTEFMPDEVFDKAVRDFCETGGGSVDLTPIVGDALIDPKFIKRVKFLRALPQIDRIIVTTNAILLHKHGVTEFLNSGISFVNISTAGFDKEMYKRVYRVSSYEIMLKNVVNLLEENSKRPTPIPITIALRPDISLAEVEKHPDFQKICKYKPLFDFTWSFTSAGGRITSDNLPKTMKLRTVGKKKEPCVNTYNGPMVLRDGTVLACSCVAAMDSEKDLSIGNIHDERLSEIWIGQKLKNIRKSFGTDQLNSTCSKCDMYRDLELYKTREGRERAKINKIRNEGNLIKRPIEKPYPFMGG